MSTPVHAHAMLIELGKVFDGEIAEVRPRQYFLAFPVALECGERTVGPLSPCADCEHTTPHVIENTWARFGDLALCMAHAWGRWRVEQAAYYQAIIEASCHACVIGGGPHECAR